VCCNVLQCALQCVAVCVAMCCSTNLIRDLRDVSHKKRFQRRGAQQRVLQCVLQCVLQSVAECCRVRETLEIEEMRSRRA